MNYQKDKEIEKKRYNSRASKVSNSIKTFSIQSIPKFLRKPYEIYYMRLNQYIDKKTSVLELAAGMGEHTQTLVNIGAELTVTDISEESLKNIKKVYENKLETKVADIENLPFKDKSYHNIICLESAFHYNPRKDFFDESYRILKDNDSELVIADIVLKNKNYGYLQSGFVNFFKELLSVPEDNLIVVDEYVKDLQDSGFEVRKFNITDKTFKPYFTNFIKNHRFSFAIYNKLIQVICNNLDYVPFEYYIFKCKKLKK